MKAAVLHKLGTSPKYENFPDPVPKNEGQVLINVKAASLKNLDKLKAAGKHYTTYIKLPAVPGTDGVGILEDGTKIYSHGITGMMAEKALVEKNKWTVLPGNIKDETAAALPNALMGAGMALVYKAEIKKGDTVLINGATGVTGKIAVQVAKYYGASNVIALGRNNESLENLNAIGADIIISLKLDDESIIKKIKEVHSSFHVDIVIDYLWGHPMELILSSFAGLSSKKIKIVTVGEMAGTGITLPSGILRSSAIEIFGSGIGSVSREEFEDYNENVLPLMFRLAASGKLKIDVETVELKDVENAWTKIPPSGKRIVFTM